MPPIMKCGMTETPMEKENEIKLAELSEPEKKKIIIPAPLLGEPEITTFRPKIPQLPQLGRKPKQLPNNDSDFDVEFIDDGLFSPPSEEEVPDDPNRDREFVTSSTTTTTTTTTTRRTTRRTTTTTRRTTRRTTTTEVPTLAESGEQRQRNRDEIEDFDDEDSEENEVDIEQTTRGNVEAFPDDYFDEGEDDDDEDDEDDIEEDDDEDDDGVLKMNTKPMTFYHCLFGGYGPLGPIAAVGHVGAAFITRVAPIISPLPPAFPLGSQGIFATIYKKQIFTCSPGAVPENGQFFSFFGMGQRVFQAGQCYSYARQSRSWRPFSSPMNSYRGGASIARMGRFIVASGGNRFPAPLSSIEVLNTRKPERWRTLSKLTLPNPTYDHCTVAINKTSLLVTGGFGQESQAIVLDLLGKKYEAQQPMTQPRRKVSHQCHQ